MQAKAESKRRTRLLLAVLACVLTTASCTSGSDNEGGNSADGGSGGLRSASGSDADVELVSSYQPVFVENSCVFAVPQDTSPLCGTVTVPANWTEPDGPSIDLAFAVFSGPTEDEGGAPDPVVYLEGGPGSHTLETVLFSFDLLFRPLTAERDVILFDQRGVGESEPRLDCFESNEVELFLGDNPGTTDEEALALTVDSVAACDRRLSQAGIDLTDYDSIQNARDVEALRVALGYNQWNLFGISYGTRLGLEVLRRFPDSVRSAVLDSVYPPNVEAVAENPSTFVDSFEKVVAACQAEVACAEPGDFKQRIQDLVVELEADPLPASVENWITGERDDVFVDGETLQSVVSQALYSPSSFTDLPEVVTDLEQGEVKSIEVFLSQSRTNDGFFSSGMFFALTCRDEVAFADADGVDAALPESPFEPGQPFNLAINVGPAAFELCDAFDVGAASSEANQAVVSDVPTMLLAGGFDPVTPVSWAEVALETLSSGHLVVAENRSHAVSADACGIALTAAFFSDPSQAPDASCFDADSIQFLGVPSAPIELETVTLDNLDQGLPMTIVRPVGWEDGGFAGYRGASTLDSAAIYQLAGNSMVGQSIQSSVESSENVTFGEPVPFAASDTVGSLNGSELDFGWTRSSARSDEVVVEWFERSLGGGSVAIVALVAPVNERDRLTEEVLIPALRGFTVEPS